MPYPIDRKLVVAVSSTALFDFSAEHELFKSLGVDEFRTYQREHRRDLPNPGTAFPFIKSLLKLNAVYSEERPVEVVLLSRIHADAGLRVLDAIERHGLEISRTFFLAGGLPYRYMESLDAVLYLSTDRDEVRKAVREGFPAGYVLPCEAPPDDDDSQLRIAFDFDGVIASDEAEAVYSETGDLDAFYEHEKRLKEEPLEFGPLMPLLRKISGFQMLERQKAQNMEEYTQMLRIAIVTARKAPGHERILKTLAAADIDADELFLLGGIEKKTVLDVLKPQIFFDDQIGHLEPASTATPCVHVPFGVANIED